MSLMNLFISSLVQSAAQAMGDNSTHTLHVEESTTYVNEYSLMSSFYDFMNPTSIAKGFHVVAGAFLIYWILRLEYATVSKFTSSKTKDVIGERSRSFSQFSMYRNFSDSKQILLP